MKKLTILTVVLSLCTAGVVFADKPEKAAQGKDQSKAQGKAKNKGQAKARGNDAHVTVVFGDKDRSAARDYFVSRYGRGNCPPGLAKKNNGCLPPGQARKRYVVGQRLSPDVIYIDAPADLVVRLSPPSGHKYVVVDGDLVKLAIGTLLVVDAIDGLIH
jgi:Ni/Co efflux regulator RcnB